MVALEVLHQEKEEVRYNKGDNHPMPIILELIVV